MTLKIATWNVNSLRVRLPQVLDWLSENQPDILALQETKVTDDLFPEAAIREAGYHVVFSGQKTYNGMATLSKAPQTEICKDLPTLDHHERRVLVTTNGKLRIWNIYVPNGEAITSDKYQFKLTWLKALKSSLEAELLKHPELIVLGDFNIAPEARDVHDPKAWEGQVLFSEPERAALQQLIDLGLADCFRLKSQAEEAYSWWDYRMNAFKRNRGLRIDHILASKALAKQCQHCLIDKTPRGWERPSDHTPVMAEFS